MMGGGRFRLRGLATILAVSIAVGALIVVTGLPAVTAGLRLDGQTAPPATTTSCSTGQLPVIPGYDPVTHEIYVPDEGGDISVFNETCNLVGTISLASGADPWQIAFNPESNDMYVTEYGLSDVAIISGTTVVQTISGFASPTGIIYDPNEDAMAVVNSGYNSVSFIYETDSVYLGFYTGSDPYGIVWDAACGCDYVTNQGSDNVTIFQDDTGNMWSVSVGKDPEGIAFSPISPLEGSGLDYVANAGSNSVSVIEGLTVIDTIGGFHKPDAVAWDQATLLTDVTNVGNGKVYAINQTAIVQKFSTASDSGPSGLAYNEFNNDMYVTGYDTDKLYVLT